MTTLASAATPAATPPAVTNNPATVAKKASWALKASATLWFVVAALGQLMFVVYIAGFYGRAAVQGQFENWNKKLPHGYVPGDTAGNLVLASHLLFTTIIILSGVLQLTPTVRRLVPRFHRWNGRVYLMSALVMSLGGLTMMLTRGAVGNVWQHLGTGLNALVIIGCAGMALQQARARRFDRHRRWALRLFLAVSGVWFFRVGLMFWIVVNQGPVGFDPKTFQGPFLTFLSFGQYLIPLAVLQLYFRAQASTRNGFRIATASSLVVCSLITAVGILAATKLMWLPRL